ncbi:MAG TPA: bifunctional diguanylate cyclase/phosphodiesterase [Candidatus Elarobacter sp.]|jgi:diguanylate cyclase (GGDEF)-like protein
MPARRFAALPTYAVGSIVLAALAAAALPVAHVVIPALAPFGPGSLIAAAAGEVATFGVLVALYARAPRRSTAVLALTYLAAAVLTVVQAASLPLGSGSGPFLRFAPDAPVWLYAARCLGFAGCAFAYAALRGPLERELVPAAARRYLAGSCALFALLTAAAIVIASGAGGNDALVHQAAAVLRAAPLALLLLLACALAAGAVLARGVRTGLDAGLALVAVALTLDVALFLVDGRRFTGAWYAMHFLYLGASTFVFAASIADLLRWRTRALHLEVLLAEQLHRVEHHSRRLETFWNLTSKPGLHDEAFLRTVLVESAEAVHPGPRFHGMIAHLEGAEIVIDINDHGGVIDNALQPGARLPLAQTLLSELLRTGRTCAWDDVRAHASLAHIPRVRQMPWRAFVGTPFRVGPAVYFLTFTSESALLEPFSGEDRAYVEIVAAFCASRLQQRVQLERLQHQSMHDPVTGLPNRAAFRVAGTRELSGGAPLAVAVVDVDRFRQLNETLGHQTADAVLVEVAAALAARAGDGNLVARLGGDTFGVLMPAAASHEDVERRVARLHGAFGAPFGTGDRDGKQRVAVTASIGIAVAPADGTAFEKLLARADAAVSVAKQNGRARWSFFDRSVEDAFAQARTMQNDLAEALVRGEFVLHYQPHIELATGRLAGAEALIRWQHPERGLVAPAEFVPFAEEHGMLGAIGDWVMRETVRASREWRAADPRFRMWFNLSAVELNDPALVRRLHELGDLRGMGAEITESIAMRDVRATMRTVAALREAGLQIALDDFGTGYSSFAHLKRLPIDVVKIDRAFTSGVPDDPHDAAIVEAVVGLATRYGFATVAEGVETARQAAYVRRAGCTYAQGFVYAPPLDEAAFATYLREARNTPREHAYMRA